MSVMRMHLDAPLPAILRALPGCSIPLARLVGKMLKKHARKRHPSYADLIAEIESVREQIESGATNAGPSATVQAWKQIGEIEAAPAASYGLLWAGLAAALLIASGGVWWMLQPERKRGPGVPPVKTARATGGTPMPQPAATPARPLVAASMQPVVGSPETATADAPFVNSFGMKFVPVPITGGPTDGQRVLFSVWETREQDYVEFVRETKCPWPRLPFQVGPTHPAANLSWEDAQAFCAWLTERDRNAGALSAGLQYRLPTDHEWSCAVGIGEREDPMKTPRQKAQQIKDLYPWGTAWPPPPGSGNLCGEEAAGLKRVGYQQPLSGYRDEFPDTAPVGSFMANAFGLHDLAGNIWEWCQEPYDQDPARRLARGGTFFAGQKQLLSSARHGDGRDSRTGYTGFRPVLAPAEAAK